MRGGDFFEEAREGVGFLVGEGAGDGWVGDVAFDGADGSLCVAMEDGLAYRVRVDLGSSAASYGNGYGDSSAASRDGGGAAVKVVEEFVGGDCEPVRGIRVEQGGGAVWSAADDGVLRKY